MRLRNLLAGTAMLVPVVGLAQTPSPGVTTWASLLAAGVVTPTSTTTIANEVAPLVATALQKVAFSGVALDSATVGGETLATFQLNTAAQLAALIPSVKIGAPSGVAPLDVNGLVPVANLPALTAVDSTARAAAAAAATAAASAVQDSTAGKPLGYAQLDSNALVPTAEVNPASIATDTTARSAAAAANTLASSAIQSAAKGAANGVAALDSNGLVPVGQINPASVATDSTARSAAAAAATTANAAIPATQKGQGSGVATLTSSGLVPTSQIDPASIATDSTARAAAAAAAATAGAAIPSSTLGQANGPAKLTSSGLVPTTEIDPTSVATDATARSAASAAQTTATNAQAIASAAIPSTQKGAASGVAALDTNGLVPTSEINSSSAATDATARAAAAAAQTTASAAVPTSTANAANGYAKLDSGGLVPTGLINSSSIATDSTARAAAAGAQTAASAAQATANAAVPSSAVGSTVAPLSGGVVPAGDIPIDNSTITISGGHLVSNGGGAATVTSSSIQNALNANGATPVDLSAQKRTATGTGAVPRTLSAAASDVVNGADYGMACNGTADDTSAFTAAVAAAQQASAGAEIDLPAGTCLLSSSLALTVTKSILIQGKGQGATHLVFTDGSGTTNGDGLIITGGNNANVTVKNFSVSKKAGTNAGVKFLGRAVIVQGQYVAGTLAHQNIGHVVIQNIEVYGATPGNVSGVDGWNIGIGTIDVEAPYLVGNNVEQPGGAVSSTFSSPSNLQARPTAYLPGGANEGADYYLGGNVMAQGSSGANQQDYTLDATFFGNYGVGGLTGVELDGTQGGQITENHILAAEFGLRADSLATLQENILVAENYFQGLVDAVYINNIQGVIVAHNHLWQQPAGSGAPTWVAVWDRNDSGDTITGNPITAFGAPTTDGIMVTNDTLNSYAGGTPRTVTGNTVLNTTGIGIGNSTGVGNLSVTGNSVLPSSGIATQDASATVSAPFGVDNNQYFDNISHYPDVTDDANGDVQMYHNLTLGNSVDNGSLTILGDNGLTLATIAQEPNNGLAADLTVSGNIVGQGNGAAPSSITINGSINATGNAGGPSTIAASGAMISGSRELLDGTHSIYSFIGTLYVVNGGLTIVNGPSGQMVASSGDTVVSGKMRCSGSAGAALWTFYGTLGGSPYAEKTFQATGGVDGSTTPSGWALALSATSVSGATGTPVLSLTGNTGGTADCTAQIDEMLNQ